MSALFYWLLFLTGNRMNDEGRDDMPAHSKASFLEALLLLPVSQSKLVLGTWQGIWLGEHRIDGGQRRIVATLQGDVEI